MNLSQRPSIAQRLKSYVPYTNTQPDYPVEGRLLRMVGLTLEAVGCKVAAVSYTHLTLPTNPEV